MHHSITSMISKEANEVREVFTKERLTAKHSCANYFQERGSFQNKETRVLSHKGLILSPHDQC